MAAGGISVRTGGPGGPGLHIEGFVSSDTRQGLDTASVPQTWVQMHHGGESSSCQDPSTQSSTGDVAPTPTSFIRHHHRVEGVPPGSSIVRFVDEIREDDRSSKSVGHSAGPPDSEMDEPSQTSDQVPGIPQPILIISLVSATLTMASCVFNTLLPIYMVTELKMNMRSMGAFEGVMEGFSYIVRMFSGVREREGGHHVFIWHDDPCA